MPVYFCFMLRDDHRESVLSSMQTIMVVLLEESEDVPDELLSILLSTLGREKKVSTSPINALANLVLFSKRDNVEF